MQRTLRKYSLSQSFICCISNTFYCIKNPHWIQGYPVGKRKLPTIFWLLHLLFFNNVFSDIQSDRNNDNDTLCNVLQVRVQSQELQSRFQKLEYCNTDDNSGDLTDTTVYRYSGGSGNSLWTCGHFLWKPFWSIKLWPAACRCVSIKLSDVHCKPKSNLIVNWIRTQL